MRKWRFIFYFHALDASTGGKHTIIGLRHIGAKREGDRYAFRGLEIKYGLPRVPVCLYWYWDCPTQE